MLASIAMLAQGVLRQATRSLVCTLCISLLAVGTAQVVVPSFGSRGGVPADILERFMPLLRGQLETLTGLRTLQTDLVTPGLAASLEPGFALIIAELGGGRYGLSGTIVGPGATLLPGETLTTESYSVNALIVDRETGRASDLISLPLAPGNLGGAATALAEALAAFLSPAGTLPAGSALLLISSQPPEADVYLDSILVGQTSRLTPLELVPGRYNLELRKDGYLPYRETVVLLEGQSQVLTLNLTPLSGGSIQVLSTPMATVYLEGEAVGTSPVTLPASPGIREVRLERPGFLTETQSVVVRDFRVSRLSSALTPATDTMFFWDTPAGFSLFINGVERREGYLENPRRGVHIIDLRRGAYRINFTVTLEGAGVYRLDLESRSLEPYGFPADEGAESGN